MTLRMNSVCFSALTCLLSDPVSVSLDPPLPVYLFNVVAGLRDKSAKGYPIKKVIRYLDAS